MIHRLGDKTPQLDPTVFVAPGASAIGAVTIGADGSVWFGAVIRGDSDAIRIGARSNVQDGAVLHVDPGVPLQIGDDVTIGHQAMLHGCTIGDGALIGIQAVVLNGAVIGSECLVGAGAIVTERKVFADGSLIIGAPARVVRQLSPEERQKLRAHASNYARRAAEYRSQLMS